MDARENRAGESPLVEAQQAVGEDDGVGGGPVGRAEVGELVVDELGLLGVGPEVLQAGIPGALGRVLVARGAGPGGAGGVAGWSMQREAMVPSERGTGCRYHA